MQSGKDTFGNALARFLGAVTIAFADPLKEIAVLLGMPYSVAYGGEKERRAWKKFLKAKGRECDGREWLQWLGTEFGREQVGEDVWLERLVEHVKGRRTRPFFVVTDARFENELLDRIEELAQEAGLDVRFFRVRLKRSDAPGGETHVSETEQLGIPDSAFDEVVTNDGTKKDLEAAAVRLADKIQRGLAGTTTPVRGRPW
jgi:hypothetical protein